jgi:hypothetical protein
MAEHNAEFSHDVINRFLMEDDVSPISLSARKSSLFIHGQSVDVVQEVANLLGKQRWRALGEVQFDAFQKQRFFSGNGVCTDAF